jgi:hypothetical protein
MVLPRSGFTLNTVGDTLGKFFLSVQASEFYRIVKYISSLRPSIAHLEIIVKENKSYFKIDINPCTNPNPS